MPDRLHTWGLSSIQVCYVNLAVEPEWVSMPFSYPTQDTLILHQYYGHFVDYQQLQAYVSDITWVLMMSQSWTSSLIMLSMEPSCTNVPAWIMLTTPCSISFMVSSSQRPCPDTSSTPTVLIPAPASWLAHWTKAEPGTDWTSLRHTAKTQ